LVIASIGTAATLVASTLFVAGATTPAAAVLAVLLLALVLFGRLGVTVTDSEVTAAFTLGFPARRIALTDIRTFRTVRNPWFYGWGIRAIPGGWMFNVSGLDAVELVLVTGHRFRIGTDEPDALHSALARAAGEPAPLDPEQEAQQASKARALGWLLAGLTFAIVAAIGVAIWLETRPIEAELLEGTLAVHGHDYAVSDIATVELVDALPPIEARTNGFAFGSTMHGWFRLAEWGQGQLFIRHGYPPYAVLRMKPGISPAWVVLNLDDEDETRKLYWDLAAAIE
jgi:hypothetical protein